MASNPTASSSYIAMLREMHSAPDSINGRPWGDTPGTKDARWLQRRGVWPKIMSVLDYGAGKARFRHTLAEYAPQASYTPYDPGIPKYDVLPDGKFDLVFCKDVLEHVEPEYIGEVLCQIAERTGKLAYLRPSTAPATLAVLPTGENAHLIVQDSDWWIELVSQWMHVVDYAVKSDSVAILARPRQ